MSEWARKLGAKAEQVDKLPKVEIYRKSPVYKTDAVAAEAKGLIAEYNALWREPLALAAKCIARAKALGARGGAGYDEHMLAERARHAAEKFREAQAAHDNVLRQLDSPVIPTDVEQRLDQYEAVMEQYALQLEQLEAELGQPVAGR